MCLKNGSFRENNTILERTILVVLFFFKQTRKQTTFCFLFACRRTAPQEWFARNYRAVLQRTPERQVAAALKKKNPALLAPEKNPKNSKQEEQWFFLLRTTKRTARRMMFFCSSWGSFLGILRESKPEEPFCCSKQKHKLTTDKQQGSIQQETRFCFFVSGSFKNKKKHKLTTNNVVEQHQVPGSWLSGSSETNHGFW